MRSRNAEGGRGNGKARTLGNWKAGKIGCVKLRGWEGGNPNKQGNSTFSETIKYNCGRNPTRRFFGAKMLNKANNPHLNGTTPWHGRPAMFASICLLVLLLLGDIVTALSGTDRNSGSLAQVTDQGRGVQTNSEASQPEPRNRPDSGSSEPAKEGSQPSDRNSPRQPSAPQKEFKPSEQIDVDKAVDFPVDI